MPEFDIAHFKEQGQDVIAVFVSDQVEDLSEVEQNHLCRELQFRANNAGISGNVALVWQEPSGHLGYRVPSNWKPFFDDLDYDRLADNINTRLRWKDAPT